MKERNLIGDRSSRCKLGMEVATDVFLQEEES
jgi:hypothetical protein